MNQSAISTHASDKLQLAGVATSIGGTYRNNLDAITVQENSMHSPAVDALSGTLMHLHVGGNGEGSQVSRASGLSLPHSRDAQCLDMSQHPFRSMGPKGIVSNGEADQL